MDEGDFQIPCHFARFRTPFHSLAASCYMPISPVLLPIVTTSPPPFFLLLLATTIPSPSRGMATPAMPFALPLLFSPSPLPLRSLANHTVIRSKFVAKITSVYETVLPTFCHKNSIRPLAPLRSFYIGTWPYCDIFICSPRPQRTTVYLPAPTTYELPTHRSLIYRGHPAFLRGFFPIFFSSCFLLCWSVGLSPVLSFASRTPKRFASLRLCGTSYPSLYCDPVDTGVTGACRTHGEPVHPGYFGLDQNLLDFVLRQSLCPAYRTVYR
jgi:hypothetical protein